MKNKEYPMDDLKIEGESTLAYTYYKLYRDMLPNDRSLEALTQIEIKGKMRTKSVFTRWSKRHEWQRRVKRFDTLTEKAAYEQLMHKQKKMVEKFIDKDLDISFRVQNLCDARLKVLENPENKTEDKTLRQLVLTYKECREWIKNLAGILQDIPQQQENDEQKEKTEKEDKLL